MPAYITAIIYGRYSCPVLFYLGPTCLVRGAVCDRRKTCKKKRKVFGLYVVEKLVVRCLLYCTYSVKTALGVKGGKGKGKGKEERRKGVKADWELEPA